jgi:glycosyltransferase involved in cell wall biosynthesis
MHKNLTLLYLAQCPNDHFGVLNKVINTTKALQDKNVNANYKIIDSLGLEGILKMMYEIWSLKVDILVLRSTGYSMFILIPVLFFFKCKGKKIVLDIPTPNQICLLETKGNTSNPLFILIKYMGFYFSFPIVNFIVDRILQYAPESWWFSLGAKKKTELTTNCIRVKGINYKEKIFLDKNVISLIAVANIADWHGYDRILKGLATYKPKLSRDFVIEIVGDGVEKNKLEKLVSMLSLNKKVTFHGFQKGKELEELYDNADIGIGSLAIHRKGLEYASELKLREYGAIGLPMVLAAQDPVFNEQLSFVHKVPLSEKNIDFYELNKWVDNLILNKAKSKDIREYTQASADFAFKTDLYINF